MKTQDGVTRSVNLGPFLTLLLMVTSGRLDYGGGCTATVETVSWESGSQTSNYRSPLSPVHGNATYLGPFLTLILTLHRRKMVDGTRAIRGKSVWCATPFVRIGPCP